MEIRDNEKMSLSAWVAQNDKFNTEVKFLRNRVVPIDCSRVLEGKSMVVIETRIFHTAAKSTIQ
jgi:hypothetical protein